VTVTVTFPSVAASASQTPLDLYAQLATSPAQSSPSGVLPTFTGTGTVYGYIVVYTGTGSGVGVPSGSLIYNVTPKITLSDSSGITGSTCNVYLYQGSDTGVYSWQTGVYSAEPISSGSVTFPSGPAPGGSGEVNLQAQQSLLAIACS